MKKQIQLIKSTFIVEKEVDGKNHTPKGFHTNPNLKLGKLLRSTKMTHNT